jgi:hypothetical protein
MPDDTQNPTQAQPTSQTGKWDFTNWITATGIVTFTLTVAYLSVVLLASTLTQSRMSGLVIDGVSLTIWKLDSIRHNWAPIQSEIEEQTQALTSAELKRTANNSRRSAANVKFGGALGRLNPLLEQFSYQVMVFDPDMAHEMTGKGPAEQLGRIQAVRDHLKQEHPGLEPLMKSVEDAYQTFQPAAVEHEAAEAEGKALVEEISQLQSGIDGSQTSLAKVFTNIKANLDDANRARVENALYELAPAGFIGTIINHLVTAQPEVLTLSLVIMMGLLGSSLQITNSYFMGSRDVDVGSYFLQVCVGAIAALVIFVVAKAGVPVITDTSKIGGDAPINPYFVSFIAIISGLLSERAVAFNQKSGRAFFRTQDTGRPQQMASA